MLKQVIETWVKLIVIQYNEDSKLSLGLSCFVFWSTCWMILCTLSVILCVDLCLACVCCVCTAWARVLPACDWLNWQRYEIWGFGIIVLSWVFVCTSLNGDNNLITSLRTHWIHWCAFLFLGHLHLVFYFFKFLIHFGVTFLHFLLFLFHFVNCLFIIVQLFVLIW